MSLGCEKAEADTGEIRPQAKDSWSPQKLEELRGDPPRASGGTRTSQYLDFRLPVSSTVTETFLQFLAPQIMVICYCSARTLIHHHNSPYVFFKYIKSEGKCFLIFTYIFTNYALCVNSSSIFFLKNSLKPFFYFLYADDEFSQFLFAWKSVYLALTLQKYLFCTLNF